MRDWSEKLSERGKKEEELSLIVLLFKTFQRHRQVVSVVFSPPTARRREMTLSSTVFAISLACLDFLEHKE